MIEWATIADPQHRLCLNPELAKKFNIDFWYNTEDGGQHYTLPGNHGLLSPATPIHPDPPHPAPVYDLTYSLWAWSPQANWYSAGAGLTKAQCAAGLVRLFEDVTHAPFCTLEFHMISGGRDRRPPECTRAT